MPCRISSYTYIIYILSIVALAGIFGENDKNEGEKKRKTEIEYVCMYVCMYVCISMYIHVVYVCVHMTYTCMVFKVEEHFNCVFVLL